MMCDEMFLPSRLEENTVNSEIILCLFFQARPERDFPRSFGQGSERGESGGGESDLD